MGDVHRCTPEQLPLLTIWVPVSPSTPTSAPPLVNQTIALSVPLVVVAIGPVVTLAIGAHQATVGTGGLPGPMRTDMTARPETPPGQPLALLVVENTKYDPIAVRYAPGAV